MIVASTPHNPSALQAPPVSALRATSSWATQALRGLVSSIVKTNHERAWQDAGHGVAGLTRATAVALLAEEGGLSELQQTAFLMALETVLGMRWPAPMGTLADLLHECTSSLVRGKKPDLAALVDEYVAQLEAERAALAPARLQRRSGATSVSRAFSEDTSKAGTPTHVPGDGEQSQVPTRASGSQGADAPWMWGLDEERTVRPEILGKKRFNIVHGIGEVPDTDLSLREEPWEFERRRRERARLRALRIAQAKADEESGEAALQAMTAELSSEKKGASPGQDPAGPAGKKDGPHQRHAQSCRVIGIPGRASDSDPVMKKYAKHHAALEQRESKWGEERQRKIAQRNQGWPDVRELIKTDDVAGVPKVVVMRSFDKKAVVEMRGGKEWRGWLAPKAVKEWGRVAGGFAPVAKVKVDPPPPPPPVRDEIYTWITSDGDSLDLSAMADEIAGATAAVDSILGRWGDATSPLYLRYLQLLGDMREEDGLRLELKATPLSAISDLRNNGFPDTVVGNGLTEPETLLTLQRHADEVRAKPPRESLVSRMLSETAPFVPPPPDAEGRQPAQAPSNRGGIADTNSNFPGPVASETSGRMSTPVLERLAREVGQLSGFDETARSPGAGKMTVDEATIFGTKAGDLVRATRVNGSFRDGMGKDRVMPLGEPGTSWYRVSVPAGWGPKRDAEQPGAADFGAMSLAANLTT